MQDETIKKPQEESNEKPILSMSMHSQLQACHWSPKMTGTKQGRERDVKHTRNNALEALRADYGDVTNDEDGRVYETYQDETFAYGNPTRLEELLETTPVYATPTRTSGHENQSVGATEKGYPLYPFPSTQVLCTLLSTPVRFFYRLNLSSRSLESDQVYATLSFESQKHDTIRELTAVR